MNPKYSSWIALHYPDNTGTEAYGKCAEATELMVAEFPELLRVRGHYMCAIWGMREHWWCETADGEVIDPTANQFPTKGVGTYITYVPDERGEPTGKCLDCGEYTYDGRNFCSDRCERATRAYMGLD